VVFEQPIPDRRLLTALSAFWFTQLQPLGPTRFLSTDAGDLPAAARSPELAGRVTWRARPVDAECVVRGCLAGSGWAGTAPAAGGRAPLPAGLPGRSAARADLHPSTKAEVGHDENITREQLATMVGAELAASSRSGRWPCIAQVRSGPRRSG
jgi:phosphoribosylaminoimidazole-succinocarboxamide synthase